MYVCVCVCVCVCVSPRLQVALVLVLAAYTWRVLLKLILAAVVTFVIIVLSGGDAPRGNNFKVSPGPTTCVHRPPTATFVCVLANTAKSICQDDSAAEQTSCAPDGDASSLLQPVVVQGSAPWESSNTI